MCSPLVWIWKGRAWEFWGTCVAICKQTGPGHVQHCPPPIPLVPPSSPPLLSSCHPSPCHLLATTVLLCRTWTSASSALPPSFPHLSAPVGPHTSLTLTILPSPHVLFLAPPQSSFAIKLDLDKCIKCSRCVTTCEEVQGMNVLGMFNRGRDRHIGFIYGELVGYLLLSK